MKDNLKVSEIDKNNWAKTIEKIVLQLKLVRGVRGDLLAYVVRQYVEVANTSPDI